MLLGLAEPGFPNSHQGKAQDESADSASDGLDRIHRGSDGIETRHSIGGLSEGSDSSRGQDEDELLLHVVFGLLLIPLWESNQAP